MSRKKVSPGARFADYLSNGITGSCLSGGHLNEELDAHHCNSGVRTFPVLPWCTTPWRFERYHHPRATMFAAVAGWPGKIHSNSFP